MKFLQSEYFVGVCIEDSGIYLQDDNENLPYDLEN